jgi:hypothetical protein
MKLLSRRLLRTGASCAIAAATTLILPACTDTGYRSTSSSAHYQVRGRYYHCHPGGLCHSVRHSNYYWSGGAYRPRYHSNRPHYQNRPSHRPPHQRPRPLPARPRPR